MIDRIESYIRMHEMIAPGDRVVAGVSGGADSVCLLLALEALRERLGFSLDVVHVEHGIRGEESLEDAEFVRELCGRLGVPFVLRRFDVPRVARERRLTVEEAARMCRYQAFEEAVWTSQREAFEGAAGVRRSEALGAAGVVHEERMSVRIAVAHNRDDQAETVLLNLCRGAGVRGMCGMRPVNGRIIRPLLGVSRREIEEYLALKGQEFRTDSTNLSHDYTRNKVRQAILPAMEEGINGEARAHLAAAGERFLRVQEFMERLAAERAEELTVRRTAEEIWIDRTGLLAEEEVMREYILQYFLASDGRGLKDVGAVHLEAAKRLAAGQSGRRIALPGGRELRCTGGFLVLGRQPEAESCARRGSAEMAESCARRESAETAKSLAETPLAVPGITHFGNLVFQTSLEDWKNEIIPGNLYTKWLDYDTIKNTIQLRTRRSGDYLVVNGGRRKLKKYFIDEKVLQEQRDTVPLLADGSHILWVAGGRISEACRITEHTQRVLKIQMMEEM